jgi:TctA family transporter
MTNQQASQYVFILTIISICIMFFDFFFSIIAGPQIAHYINIIALLLTIISIWILIKNRLNNYKLLLYIIINLFFGILGMFFKYGYTGWHYDNFLELMRPK